MWTQSELETLIRFKLKFKNQNQDLTSFLVFTKHKYDALEEKMNNYQLEHAFGIAGGVGFCCLESEIVYGTTSNRVVFHDPETNSQRLIALTGDVGCIATNHSRSIVAVAVKGRSDVDIYDAATLKIKAKLPASCVQFVALNKDASVALVLTNSPEGSLSVFTKKKSYDVSATMQLSNAIQGSILRADICPTNNNLISVVSSDEVAFFRLSTKMNSRFIPLSSSLEKAAGKYTTQCWLISGDLIVGTSNGKILVVGENRELKQVIDASPASVQCITTCPKGMGVGDSAGTFTLFQRARKEESSQRSRVIQM
jgi:hypothetical protein